MSRASERLLVAKPSVELQRQGSELQLNLPVAKEFHSMLQAEPSIQQRSCFLLVVNGPMLRGRDFDVEMMEVATSGIKSHLTNKASTSI